jgi:hypothetical protein
MQLAVSEGPAGAIRPVEIVVSQLKASQFRLGWVLRLLLVAARLFLKLRPAGNSAALEASYSQLKSGQSVIDTVRGLVLRPPLVLIQR